MIKMLNLKKWLPSIVFVFVLIFSGMVLAQTTGSSSNSLTDPAVTGKTDLSISYLGQIFGTVGNVLSGTSGQMLGKLFYKFNTGILVVCGGWLAFTVLQLVFKSAHTGSFLSQEVKATYIMLRIALGTSLLIPSPSTGYTLLQGIVMQVVVQGVKLADETWRYGLEYIKAGGDLWRRPNESSSAITSPTYQDKILGSSTTAITNDSAVNAGLGVAQQILANEICMVTSSMMNTAPPPPADTDTENATSNTNPTNSSSSSTTSTDSSSTSSSSTTTSPATNPTVTQGGGVSYTVQENSTYFRYDFPGLGDTNAPSTTSGSLGCGYIAWSAPSSQGSSGSSSSSGTSSSIGVTNANCGSSSTTGDNSNSNCGFAQLAVKQIIDDLMPSAQLWACANADSSLQGSSSCYGSTGQTDTSDLNNKVISALYSAAIDYANLIMPIAKGGQEKASQSAKDFIDQAEKEGWVSAGRYYWDLSRVEAYNQSVGDLSTYVPGMTSAGDARSGSPYNQNKIISSPVNSLLVQSSGGNGFVSLADAQINAAMGTANAGDTGASSTDLSSSAGGNEILMIILSVIAPFVAPLFRLISSFSTSSMGSDPIMFLNSVGTQCINIAGYIWFGTGIVLIMTMLPAKFCSSINSIGNALDSGISWMKPFFMVLAGALLSSGFILAYYIPFYPYIIFTAGVIGWLILVIEAMVAAPLVALGITHPQGHDFLGTGDKAVMLLLGVFLRPVLIVIGLIAGMILSYVSLRIVVYGFSGFVSDLFSSNGPASGGPGGDLILTNVGKATANITANVAAGGGGLAGIIMALMVFPLFLMIFSMMVYEVTVLSFNLIFRLPDYIMRWIGGPSEQSGAERMAGEIKGAISGAASTGGQAIQKMKSGEGGKDGGDAALKGLQEKQKGGPSVEAQSTTPKKSSGGGGGQEIEMQNMSGGGGGGDSDDG